MEILTIKEKGKVLAKEIYKNIYNELFIFSVIVLLYDIIVGFYFKDSPTFRFKYWTFVGFIFVIFIIVYMLMAYEKKLRTQCQNKSAYLKSITKCKQKKNHTNKAIFISIVYLILFIFIGFASISNGIKSIYFYLFTVLFLIPLIIMLLDTFRFIPADECIKYIYNYLKTYSIEPLPKSSEYKDEKDFLNQKDSAYFIIEKLPPGTEKFYPPLKLAIFGVITDILYYYVWEKENAMYYAISFGIFFIYISFLLTYYRKYYSDTIFEIKESLNIDFKINTKEIFDRFFRRFAYIFFYSYFVYWIYSQSHFIDTKKGPDYFNVFFNSIMSHDIVTSIAFGMYFLVIVGSMAMVSDGFGIVPVICNLSKEISLQIKKKEMKIDLYHPDKSAGFRPLGNFCFRMSSLIALPFIIGMPIQLYLYSISNDKHGIVNYMIDEGFNIAFNGVGIAAAIIFVFSIYYINRVIEHVKKERIKKLMDAYKIELNECKSNDVSPKLACIESAMKKLGGIEIPPYGKRKVIGFYSILFVPSILMRLYSFIKDYLKTS